MLKKKKGPKRGSPLQGKVLHLTHRLCRHFARIPRSRLGVGWVSLDPPTRGFWTPQPVVFSTPNRWFLVSLTALALEKPQAKPPVVGAAGPWFPLLRYRLLGYRLVCRVLVVPLSRGTVWFFLGSLSKSKDGLLSLLFFLSLERFNLKVGLLFCLVWFGCLFVGVFSRLLHSVPFWRSAPVAPGKMLAPRYSSCASAQWPPVNQSTPNKTS